MPKPRPAWGPADRPAMMAFERYFSWADTMRTHVDPYAQDELRAHSQPYMAYWYGGLYTVTEGWRALRFRDVRIAALLKDAEKMAFLRGYRVGAFHFQRKYFDRRFVALWERSDVIAWADQLHRAFAGFIREELPKIVESTFPHQGGG
jgi:hypothetical protein